MSALFHEDGREFFYENGRRAWKCDHCGLVSAWTETWVCFGALEDDEDLLSFCCQEHGDEHERALPHLFKPEKRKRNGQRRFPMQFHKEGA